MTNLWLRCFFLLASPLALTGGEVEGVSTWTSDGQGIFRLKAQESQSLGFLCLGTEEQDPLAGVKIGPWILGPLVFDGWVRPGTSWDTIGPQSGYWTLTPGPRLDTGASSWKKSGVAFNQKNLVLWGEFGEEEGGLGGRLGPFDSLPVSAGLAVLRSQAAASWEMISFTGFKVPGEVWFAEVLGAHCAGDLRPPGFAGAVHMGGKIPGAGGGVVVTGAQSAWYLPNIPPTVPVKALLYGKLEGPEGYLALQGTWGEDLCGLVTGGWEQHPGTFAMELKATGQRARLVGFDAEGKQTYPWGPFRFALAGRWSSQEGRDDVGEVEVQGAWIDRSWECLLAGIWESAGSIDLRWSGDLRLGDGQFWSWECRGIFQPRKAWTGEVRAGYRVTWNR